MPIYEYACGRGHRFEKLARLADADDGAPGVACPACGDAASRRFSPRVAVLGRAVPPPGPETAPRSWQETNGGDREVIGHWQATLEQRRKIEEKYPELAGDTRPVLAHEGRYATAPLRADPPAGGPRASSPGGTGR